MKTVGILGSMLAGLLALGAFGGAEAGDCQLVRYASLPITIDAAGGATVPVTIDGQAQNMLVDTGGVYTMLTQSAVARLGLTSKRTEGVWWTMFGGETLDHYVTTNTLEIAGGTVRNRKMIVMPDGRMPSNVDGILAPDILSVFDIDFDFAGGKLALFSQDHCEGKVVYWTHEYTQIPFKLDDSRHIGLTVQLDGKDVPAGIDTGSSRTLMSLDTAKDMFGFDDAALKANNGRYRFSTLTFGGVTVHNPDIILVPDDKSKVMGGYRMPGVIVGMGVLRQLHIYIAYKERNLYVSPASAH